MEECVTGDVETFIGDFYDISKIVDWEDELDNIRKGQNRWDIENVLKRLNELRTEKQEGGNKSEKVFFRY